MISELDKTYMKMATTLADMSKCISHQVACIIAKDGKIISTGINGSPPGYTNCCDHYEHMFITDYSQEQCRDITRLESQGVPDSHHEWSNLHEIHAEQNAIANAAKHGISVDGATAYTALKPCLHCSKLLISAGISRIVYKYVYERHENPKTNEMLRFCRISVEQILDEPVEIR